MREPGQRGGQHDTKVAGQGDGTRRDAGARAKVMTADLVGMMLKVNRHLRPHLDTASKAACKSDSESAGITKGSEPRRGKTGHQVQCAAQWQQDRHQQIEQERRKDTPLSSSGVKPRMREGGTNTHLRLSATEKLGRQLPHFGLTHQHQTTEQVCHQPKRCQRLCECR